MSRRLKIAGIGLIVLLIVLQFFRPELNNEPPDPELDLISLAAPPEALARVLRNACYDCHSNQTIYPWYEKLSPVSWYLHKHIRRERKI